MSFRAILFHKQTTSARTRFLMFGHGSVCAFDCLPETAVVLSGRLPDPVIHPVVVLQALVDRYGFEREWLQVEEGFRYAVKHGEEEIQIVLIAIATMDPPFELAEQIDAKFVDLTQARGLPTAELELLRGAYELVLGG
ncbi:MAG: hypothetical protein KDI88_13080 [Gammaproteobacteria bacterium]|nr:hypothetical protein [Gammaproteobacteria bacterium]